MERGWYDRSLHREYLARLTQRVLEVSGDVGHGHDEQVPEGMAVERSLLEAVVEELLHQRLGICQGDETLTKVAGRQDSIFVSQASRGAAVVGHGEDRREI